MEHLASRKFMSPVNKQTIQDKLLRLRESIKVLEELKDEPKNIFLNDPKINGAAMFNLIISIEIIVDIGNHILSEVFQKPASTYKDVIVFLGEAEVLPKEFAEENKDMADFRNKLIHDYDRVELEKVYEYLQKAPDTLNEFAKYFINFLDKIDK